MEMNQGKSSQIIHFNRPSINLIDKANPYSVSLKQQKVAQGL